MSFINLGDILKLCELAAAVYKNCRDCPGDYKSLTSEARQLTNVLEDIADKVQQEQIPQKKVPQLLDAYEACIEVLQELDKLLKHYNSLDTKSKRAWDRLKWDGEKAKTLRGKLTASVVLMNGFWTSLIHDNQVIIIQALGRLERDYAGGHREESITSVERLVSGAAEDEDDENEDAAWRQIIRDLEDVGISSQDAQEYRDFIVDWFVRAVNEGRLLERSVENVQSQRPDQRSDPLFEDPRTALTDGMTYLHLKSPPKATSNSFSSSSGISISAPSTPNYMRPGPLRENFNPSNIDPTSLGQPGTITTNNRPSRASLLSDQPGQSLSEDAGSHDHQRQESMSEFPLTPTDTQPPEESQPLPRADSPYCASDTQQTSLEVISERVVAAWEQSDYVSAEILLESHLAAVESGKCVTIQGKSVQPDRRVIRHLIGVSASYSGDFSKAKNCFEAVFNGIYLTGSNLDEGDIAAARWLGDTCLHLNEPENAALAWAAALEGSARRHGTGHDTTRRTLEELHMLNFRTGALTRLHESLFSTAADDSAVFKNSHYSEKSRLVTTALERLKGTTTLERLKGIYREKHTTTLPASGISYRPRADWQMSMSFLIQPLTWPFQYDWTFSAQDAILLHREMSTESVEFSSAHVPGVGMFQAKELHYITKRGFQWLSQALQFTLDVLGIEYKRQYNGKLICLLTHRNRNIPCLEGVAIQFRKVPFRSLYGLKVSEVLYATRGRPTKAGAFHSLEFDRDTSSFREMLKASLENAELEECKKRRV
jgi:hypothetical protein